jgi:hypothetical protein
MNMHGVLAIALSSTLVLQAAPLLAAPAASAARAAGSQTPAATGTIDATARSAAGQALAHSRVQVRDLQTGKLAATGTSDAEGAFSFAGLPPGSYVVEVVGQTGEIAGSHAAMPLVPGGTIKTQVSVTTAAATAGAASAGINTTAGMVKGAAIAAGIAITAVPEGRPNPSPSR